LRWIGSEQAVFQRRSVKAPNDRLHLIGVRSFNKGESFRFLGLVIANYLD
jgi:hypothetical protein